MYQDQNKLVAALTAENLLTKETAAELLSQAQAAKKTPEELIISRDLIAEDKLTGVKAKLLDLPAADLKGKEISKKVFNSLAYKQVLILLGVSITLYSLNSLLLSVLNGELEIKKYVTCNIANTILIFSIRLSTFFLTINLAHSKIEVSGETQTGSCVIKSPTVISCIQYKYIQT